MTNRALLVLALAFFVVAASVSGATMAVLTDKEEVTVTVGGDGGDTMAFGGAADDMRLAGAANMPTPTPNGTDNATATPPDNATSTPPDNETEGPPGNETEGPPGNETEGPPGNETEGPPGNETGTSSINETGAISVNESEASSVNETTDA